MKADLHVHSKYSRRPSEWVLKRLGCPESFTDPKQLYRVARARGMDLVTITDHNTIEGCLDIAHLPDTFISEEVTTYFPEDRCKLHVLVYRIDERVHEDIQKIRENVFDLTAYLHFKQIPHVLAHPLFSVNRKLTVDNFERCLLLFKNLELNGARPEDQNAFLQLLRSALTSSVIDHLAEKHGITPVFTEPWKKHSTSGSDDHSSLTIARCYTEVPNAASLEEFFAGIETGIAATVRNVVSPKTLARNLYGIAYQFYQDRFGLREYHHRDAMFTFLDRFLTVEQSSEPGLLAWFGSLWNQKRRRDFQGPESTSLLVLIKQEADRFIAEDPELSELTKNGNGDGADLQEPWFRCLNGISNRVLAQFADHLAGSLSGADLFNIFHALGSAGALYSLLAPYFVSFSVFSDDRQLTGRISRAVLPLVKKEQLPDRPINIAHFTDTLYEINGVAHTLHQQIAAARRLNRNYTVITCDDGSREPQDGIRNFAAIGVYELSVYPEQKLFYPPFLEILDYCYEEGFTHIHSATPGPLGLAALGVSRILNIPFVGTYHTALPQYTQYLTEDPTMTEAMWRYVLWYYDQADIVFVPSRSTAEELTEKGISPRKIQVFPRGIDAEHFHPAKGNGCLDKYWQDPMSIKLLYVGRVSKEKNLELLVKVYRRLVQRLPNVALVIVGDGPYRGEMEEALAGTPAVFLGYLQGERLASTYASCDLFVFPSTTDTFGNVILEAQASGIPVVVTDCGGPQEIITPGKTGVIVRGNSEESLMDGILKLCKDRGKLNAMGRAARDLVKNRSFDDAFDETWRVYERLSSGDE